MIYMEESTTCQFHVLLSILGFGMTKEAYEA